MGSNLGTPKHGFVVEGSSWRWTKCLLRFEFRSMTSFNQEISSSRIACQDLKCPDKETVASLYQHRYTVCTPATEVPWRRGSTANRGLAPFAWWSRATHRSDSCFLSGKLGNQGLNSPTWKLQSSWIVTLPGTSRWRWYSSSRVQRYPNISKLDIILHSIIYIYNIHNILYITNYHDISIHNPLIYLNIPLNLPCPIMSCGYIPACVHKNPVAVSYV